MKNRTTVSIITSSYIMIMTLIYAISALFLEIDNAYGGVNSVVDDDKTMMYSQQQLETECKSPCPSSAEMCIAMCA